MKLWNGGLLKGLKRLFGKAEAREDPSDAAEEAGSEESPIFSFHTVPRDEPLSVPDPIRAAETEEAETIEDTTEQHFLTDKSNTMSDYSIGGNVAKTEASEAVADIPKNRTLFVQQLTADAPVRPETVGGLNTVEDVFNHYRPECSVELEGADGTSREETLRFGNLGDFSPKKLVEQSKVMQELNIQQEQYQKIVKQLKSNKLMKTVMENAESREAFIAALQALAQELDENK